MTSGQLRNVKHLKILHSSYYHLTMNQLFVFMVEPTTCFHFHYLFDYKLVGSYVSSNEVY